MSNLKEKWQAFKDDLSFQKMQAKAILKQRWNIGAEAGKELQKKQKEKLKEIRRRKDGTQRKR
jgi:hypothetical protein